jgi:hypothetical protein
MHRQAMWPMHGKYICQQCLREYPLNWEVPARAAVYAHPVQRNNGIAATQTVSIVQ